MLDFRCKAKIYLIFFSLFLMLYSCSHRPSKAPAILIGFYERITALVTTTTRSSLRDNPSKQKILVEKIPSLEKKTTFIELMEELKSQNSLKDLAYLIEADLMFELQRSEHIEERENFNSPIVQKKIVNAILSGIRQAMAQLMGERNGK